MDLFLTVQYVPFLACFSAFVLSTRFYLYPVIINVSKQKGLMDTPDNRKMHKDLIPNLGGLGVFIAFSLSIIFYGLLIELESIDLIKLLALLGSSIILLFLGVKDDLVSMAPNKKLFGQLLAVLNVVLLTDVRVLSFDGILGFGELPYFLSILFTVFVFILVINALNLVDGIDGLAGSLSIISSIVFGVLFFVNDHYLMTLISFVLIGSILGFLRYNLSSNQKIFMGDCGSMLAGFLLAYQGISLLALNTISVSSSLVSNAPVILLAILSYPLFDLLRVFSIRIKQGKSPFSADANHIHHRLLRIGLDHKEATIVLSLLNVLVIGISFLTNDLEIHIHLLLTLIAGLFVYLIPFLSVFDEKSIASPSKIKQQPIPHNTSIKLGNLAGINSDSVVYSKRIGTLKKEEKSKISTVPEIVKVTDVEELENGFTHITRHRLKKIQRLKGKLADKKSSNPEKIVD
jgi:UDP-N-acetylmuramyl pentapeptide phosphotransferase/UDP-N-acetylglucosamine-1-phosphate transferase